MTPSVPLPEEPVSEWNAFRPFTSPGMFVYRHMQVQKLLQFPDFAGGDLTAEQRREALERAIAFRKPLAAVAIFLCVVALEDFIRDLGARIADNQLLQTAFPEVTRLRMRPLKQKAHRPFARLDEDPVSLVEPQEVNKLFNRALGVEPIAAQDFSRFRDLALIRHTVAHHAAIIRQIDVPRFQYYIVRAGSLINPPVSFVRETSTYLYQLGRSFELSLQNRIFAVVVPKLAAGWRVNQPPELVDLIELFNYFGKFVEARGPVGSAPPGTEEERRMQQEGARVKQELIRLCIEELHQT